MLVDEKQETELQEKRPNMESVPINDSPANSKRKFLKAILAASVILNVILLIAVCVVIVSYANSGSTVTSAICRVKPNPSSMLDRATRDANPIQGTVNLETFHRRLKISLNLRGFENTTDPKKHGFHVHQLGDIVTDGCQSAGGHYNPENLKHGNISDAIRHVGDWGNILVSSDGTVSTTFYDTLAKLKGSQAIVGRAIVIHQLPDDLGRGGNVGSEKTGNAGKRLACCVIVPKL